MASSSFSSQVKRTSKTITSNVASHKKMKRNFLEAGNANLETPASSKELLQKLDDAEELQASAACLLELGLSRSSKLVVNKDRPHASKPAQEKINKESVEKSDRKPNSPLKPEGCVISRLSHNESSPKLGCVEKKAADANHTIKYCGAELIGRRVKVWWPKEEMFCSGKLTYFDSHERLHLVDYDDGVKEFLDLSEERWELEQKKDSGPGASATMCENAGIRFSRPSKRKHKVAREEVTTRIGKNKKVIKTEPNSDEKTAAAAAAAAKMTTSQSSEYQKQHKALAGSPTAASVQDGNACYELVDVSGYLVKASIAPTLRSIFSKYGDIASNCPFKNHNTRSPFFEVICDVVEKLQSNDFGVITSEVKEMISEISDAAEAKMDVTWLQKLLEEINQVKEVGMKSSGLMELRANSNLIVKAARKDLEERGKQVMSAKRKFKEAKSRWEALEHVKAKVENDVVEVLAAKQAWQRRVDELL
ncbi:hypothetical protein Pfo_011902 [Paulownia fortunei]|nr:hypothetical protein Pfo_011902 [Paulownia fortunei]